MYEQFFLAVDALTHDVQIIKRLELAGETVNGRVEQRFALQREACEGGVILEHFAQALVGKLNKRSTTSYILIRLLKCSKINFYAISYLIAVSDGELSERGRAWGLQKLARDPNAKG